VNPDPHQTRAIEHFLGNTTFGCFDVAGAGKTAVAINAHLRLERFPALITVPAHLVAQWVDQLQLWGVPEDEIAATPRGSGPVERIEALFAGKAFTVVSYEMWTTDRYRPYLLDADWAAYSFDESHRLRRGGRRRRRSVEGGAYKAVKWLRTKTRSPHMKTPVWWLSATPIVKDASDVWPFLALANPYRYTSRDRFAQDTCYCTFTPYGLHIGKVRDTKQFHKELSRYSLRRGWNAIPELRDLQIRHIDVPIMLDPAQRKRHRTIKEDYRDPETGEPLFTSGAMIRALRQVSMLAKLDAVGEILADHPGRWFVLAWYRASARLLESAARKTGRPVGYIDGSVPEVERQEALARYKRNSNAILVATIASTKEGLDGLQVGNQVMFAEQHYLSEENASAWQRLYRRGQGQPVLAYWLYVRGSFDMRVRRISNTRGANIEEALSEFLEEEPWNRG
jgi:SNF2 family DNA or RNA helicase